MKHLVIAGLFAAIAAVGLTPTAHADSQYCYDNPDDNRCDYNPDFVPRFRPPPPPIDYGDDDGGWEGNPRRRPPPPEYFGEYMPPPPPRDWGLDSQQRYCMMVGRSLREQGYRRVRAVECGGKNFKYTAYREGTRYLVKVKARNGRIMYAIPN